MTKPVFVIIDLCPAALTTRSHDEALRVAIMSIATIHSTETTKTDSQRLFPNGQISQSGNEHGDARVSKRLV